MVLNIKFLKWMILIYFEIPVKAAVFCGDKYQIV